MDAPSGARFPAADKDKRPCMECGDWFSSARQLHRHQNNGHCTAPPLDHPSLDDDNNVPTLQQSLFRNFVENLEDEEDRAFFNNPSSWGTPVPSDAESDNDSDAGSECGSDAGSECGSDAGTECGSDAGTECGSDSDMDYSSDAESDVEAGEKQRELNAIISHICQFILLFATIYYMPDTPMDILLKFLSTVFICLGKDSSTCSYVASKLPFGLGPLRKEYGIKSGFRKYVVCPKCKMLYDEKDCSFLLEGKKTPKECPFVEFPRSLERENCGQPLLKVSTRNGKETLTPYKQYWYQSVRGVLSRFLQRPGFEEMCEKWRDRETKDGVMTDVYDGRIWKEFSDPDNYDFFNHMRNYGLMLNVDWFQPWKRVQYSVGAIYLVFMNLPIEERFKLENVILVGIIPKFDKEPRTNSFLKPLVDELQQAWRFGFHLLTNSSRRVPKLFKLALICCGCDIPAARKVCGFLGHSADIGCNKCLKNFKGRNYGGFDSENWQMRTNADHRRKVNLVNRATSKKMRAKREKKYGVRYSVLLELLYFDPVRMTIIDPMHNLFMGTPKRAMKVWKEHKLITKTMLNKMQERIDKFECPSDMGNIPHKIGSNFSNLTADQLKNWTILFSMYCLQDMFKPQTRHLNCWQKFVLACRCLCTRVIDGPTLERGHSLLGQFCRTFEQLYGTKSLTINMHLHNHLKACVFDYGPIYSFWLFSFERYNGVVGKFATNNHNIETQLFKKFTNAVYVRGLTFEVQIDELEQVRQVMLASRQKRGSLLSQSKPISSVSLVSLSSSTCIILNNNWNLPRTFTDNVPGQKFYEMDQQEIELLEGMYMNLYGQDVENNAYCVMYPTCHETNSLHFMGQVLGASTGRNRRSNVIGASWCDKMGHIADGERVRPGQVKRYIVHKIDLYGESMMHVIAQVHWFDDPHPIVEAKTANLRPVEAWSDMRVNRGPAMFIPIQRIKYKAVTTFDTVARKKTLFVCPRQRYLMYD